MGFSKQNRAFFIGDPTQTQTILESLANQIEQSSMLNHTPVVLCSPAVRLYVRQLTERYFPQVPILSYNEIEANAEVQSVGVVNL